MNTRIALRITLFYAALVVLLGVVARMGWFAFCSGFFCQFVSFASEIVYLMLIYPGLKTVGLLIPYHADELASVSLLRESLSFIATAVALFLVVLLIDRMNSRSR